MTPASVWMRCPERVDKRDSRDDRADLLRCGSRLRPGADLVQSFCHRVLRALQVVAHLPSKPPTFGKTEEA